VYTAPRETLLDVPRHREKKRLRRTILIANIFDAVVFSSETPSLLMQCRFGVGRSSQPLRKSEFVRGRGLPLLGRALDSGSLGWSAVRELTRVAVADTEREWLELAQGKTVRQLEELVAGKELGDEPSAPNRPVARRHVTDESLLCSPQHGL
jgi:hypothetical protein